MANIVAAAPDASGDFIVGLLIGAAVGFLLRPAIRSWVASREWAEASRWARLTDEVLVHMDDGTPAEEDVSPDSYPPAPSVAPEPSDRPVASKPWQPHP
jgi:hypothetical protein